MKIVVKNNDTIIHQKELSDYDIYRFNLYLIKKGKEDAYSAEKMMALFMFLYNTDVSDYGIDRIIWDCPNKGDITWRIREEDLANLRDSKINQILD